MKQQTSEQLLQQIHEYIGSLSYMRNPMGLYDPIEYVLGLGGKRLRPVLMLLAYNLYKEDVTRIFSQAAGIETYHNFTLLHDDLMDKADMRRNKPTVHKKWDENTAILSGDAMLILAYQFMMKECPLDCVVYRDDSPEDIRAACGSLEDWGCTGRCFGGGCAAAL